MPRSRFSFILFALVLSAPFAARALDREFVLRWLPPAGTVNGYRVYLGTAGQPTQSIDLGAVAPDPDGIAREALQLDAAKTYTVAMTAYNQAGESTQSNQISVPASTCDLAACNDGDPCTADDCQNLACTHTRLPDGAVCGSGSICLSGTCRVPQCTSDSACADGDVCDGREICSGFSCVSGTPLSCPAPGACQQGGCAAGSGCFLTNLADGTSCNDSNASTVDDRCSAGRCFGSAPSGCQSNSECSDGNTCNGAEVCGAGGACASGTPLVCGGATQCADPICSPGTGCALTPKPEGTACDDGVASTSADKCSAGQCRGTPVVETALTLSSVAPASVRGYGLHQVALSGNGFAAGMKVSFRSSSAYRRLWVQKVSVSSPQKAEVLIWALPYRRSTTWDVMVTLPDGRVAGLPAAFRTDP